MCLAYDVSQVSVPPEGQDRSFLKGWGEFRVCAKDLPVAVNDLADRWEPSVECGREWGSSSWLLGLLCEECLSGHS